MKKKTYKGFTLVELMIVIAIVGIISVMAVPSYYGSIKRAKYEEKVSEVVTLIKDARNTSIIGKFTGGVGSYETPKGGYGVYIDKVSGTLISFQDEDEDQIYTNGSDTLLQTIILPDEISIQTITGSIATGYTNTNLTNNDINKAVILFKPPQGETVLNENDKTKDIVDLNITLQRYDNNKSKRLKINKISGFITTE